MGKVIWKSALCFAGLAAASWLVQQFCDWMFFAEKQLILTMIWMVILQFIFWLLLLLAYVYLLFLIFRNEKHCWAIIRVHGLLLILQAFILILISSKRILPVNDEILYLSVIIMNAFGLPLILLASMFSSLKSRPVKAPLQKKVLNILMIIASSALCLIVLAGFSYGFNKVHNFFSLLGYVGYIFESLHFILPLCAITYAYCLYRFFRGQKRPRLLLIINALFLIIAGGAFFLFFGQSDPFSGPSRTAISIFLGNTSIMTIVLAFIFRSVEQYYASAADASALHPTPATGGGTNLPAQ